MNKLIYILLAFVSLTACTKEKEEVNSLSNFMELTIESSNSEIIWEATDFENKLYDANNRTTLEITASAIDGSTLHFILYDYRRQYGAEQIGVGDYVESAMESHFDDTEGNRTILSNGGISVTQIDPNEQRITGNIFLSDTSQNFTVKGSFVNAEYDIQ